MVGERRRVHVLRGEERVVQEDCCVISTGNQTGYNPGLRANSVCVCGRERGGSVRVNQKALNKPSGSLAFVQ